MARVRVDPITSALAHPTRRAVYVALSSSEEMSTVQLEKDVAVDRYNLYHHLKKLASLNLVENHRDVGRARWWKMSTKVDLPELLTASLVHETHAAPTSPQGGVPSGNSDVLSGAESNGDEVHMVQLDGSRDQIGAKKLLEQLAQQHGIEMNLPWNFLPDSIVLIAKKK